MWRSRAGWEPNDNDNDGDDNDLRHVHMYILIFFSFLGSKENFKVTTTESTESPAPRCSKFHINTFAYHMI